MKLFLLLADEPLLMVPMDKDHVIQTSEIVRKVWGDFSED